MEIPTVLGVFLEYLIIGNDGRRNESIPKIKKKRIETIAFDILYASFNGEVKTSKHLLLTSTVKALTNSKKLINVLNRLGHGVSYPVVEEIETELAFRASSSGRLLPDGLLPQSCLHTACAYDNYDQFVETPNGQNTLHDTVGIVYQDWIENPNSSLSAPLQEERLHAPGRRRRTFESSPLQLEPYHKKPRMLNEAMLSLDDPRRANNPPSLKEAKLMDLAWMASIALNLTGTPMWFGWNNLMADSGPHSMQKVCYLPQINQSPTSTSVVLETMKMSQRIREECGKRYMLVTYDLAIAKIAFALQVEEKSRFEELFILLGGFHVELSLFKV